MFVEFWRIFLTVFIVVDPLSLVPFFISLSADMDRAAKGRTIRKSVAVAFVTLLVFILAGKAILSFFGVGPGAFYVAGGILLFIIAVEMLFGRTKSSKTSPDEEDSQSVAVFPLAIPMLVGPGAITTVMLYTSQEGAPALAVLAMLALASALTLAVAAVVMRSSGLLLRILGKTGVSVIERIMGLLLSGLAVQFVFNGLVRLGALAAIP
jgi:multiple antibiotic resistance protein